MQVAAPDSVFCLRVLFVVRLCVPNLGREVVSRGVRATGYGKERALTCLAIEVLTPGAERTFCNSSEPTHAGTTGGASVKKPGPMPAKAAKAAAQRRVWV